MGPQINQKRESMNTKAAGALVGILSAFFAQADYVKLGSARISSMNDLGSAASALGILAEQPMIGMMAMGGLQQGVMGTFGAADALKPMGAIIYSKVALPDFKGLDSDALEGLMEGMATNIAYAVFVPVSEPVDAYLKGRGATNAVDGAFKGEGPMFVVAADGYAVWGDSPATVKIAAAERADVLKAQIDGSAVEVSYGKLLMRKYGEFMPAMMAMQKQMEAEMAGETEGTNVWKRALEEYQEASIATAAKMLDQIDALVIGFGADVNRGVGIGALCAFAPGSDMAAIMQKAVPVSPALYAAIPANSDLFYAVGDAGQMAYDTEASLTAASKTLVPQIADAAIRAQVETILADLLAVTKESGASAMFLDRDKAGRLVVVSQSAAGNPEQLLAKVAKIHVAARAVLDALMPGQTFMTGDATGKLGIDFPGLFKALEAKFASPGDETSPEEMEKFFKVLDVLFGRSLEGASQVRGGSVVNVCRPVGSDYAPPVAGDGAANAARMAALMPKSASAKPFQVFSMSSSSLVRHYGRKIAAALGEDGAEAVKMFDTLPEAPAGGIGMVVWAEGSAMKASMNLSAAEFKWFVKLFAQLAAQQEAENAEDAAAQASEKACVEDDDTGDTATDDEDDDADAPPAE